MGCTRTALAFRRLRYLTRCFPKCPTVSFRATAWIDTGSYYLVHVVINRFELDRWMRFHNHSAGSR